jgi:hypothetical protein
MKTGFEAVLTILGAITLAAIVAFFCAFLTEYAWNHSLAGGGVAITAPIDFWQAFWLNILGSTVVKSSMSFKSGRGQK